MGFARAADFAREQLGRSARWLRDLAALHRGLSTLTGLGAALTGEDGAPIGRRRAFLVARVADASTLAAWVARARSLTVRELQAEVARALQMGASDSPEADVETACAASTSSSDAASAAADAPMAATRTDGLDDSEDRRLVLLAAPRAVVAAFDEAIDLYRAVEGADATVTSFVEALVAEASAGGGPATAIDEASACPGETRCDPTAGAPSASVIEMALARSTDRWRHLSRSADASWGLALGRSTLARLAAIVRAGAEGTAAERVARMKELLAIENEIEIHLGRLLASMGEQDAWNRLRFASMVHYAEERLGLSRTAAQTRARAARALGCFPLLRDAYEHDAIGLEATLLVGRVLSAVGSCHAGWRAKGIAARADGAITAQADVGVTERADFEAAWVAHAAEVTFKRLRDEERALGRLAAFHPWSGEGEGTTPAATMPMATTPGVGALAAVTRRAVAAPPDDADWHASLRREAGTARRRVTALGLIALGVRPELGGATPATTSAASASAVSACVGSASAGLAFDPATSLVPEPDVFLRLTLPDGLAGHFLAAIEKARSDLTVQMASIPWDAQWPPSDALAPTPSLLAARMFSVRSRRVPVWVGLLAMLEDFVATSDTEGDVASGAATSRAAHRVASREDAILVRDGWRCAAPSCSSRRNLEVHHVLYRSRGGGDQDWNLVTLCRFHHQRGEHGGLAGCEGRAPLGLTWRLGAGASATWYRNERRIATRAHQRQKEDGRESQAQARGADAGFSSG